MKGVGCPTHRDAPQIKACQICSAWYQIDVARKKIAIQEERLALDKQLVKAERKHHKRNAKQAQVFQNERLQLKHEQELQELQAELRKTKLQTTKAQSELKQQEYLHQEELGKMKKKLNDSVNKDEFERMKKECNQLQTQLKEQTSKFQAQEKESITQTQRKFESEMESLQGEHQTKLQLLQQQVREHETQMEKLKQEHEQDIIRAVEEQREEHNASREFDKQKAADQHRMEIEEQEQRLQELQHQLGEKQNQLKEKDSQLEEKQHKLTEKENQLEEKRHQLEESQSQLEESQKEMEEQNGPREIVFSPPGASDGTDQSQRVQDLENQLAEQKKQWDKEKEEYERIAVELEAKTSELEEQLDLQMMSSEKHKNRPQGDGVGGACTNCEQLEEDIYDMRMKLHRRQLQHQKQIADHKDAIGELERELDRAKERALSAMAEGSNASERSLNNQGTPELESKLLYLEAQNLTLEREKQELESALREANTAIADSRAGEGEVADLRREIEQLKAKNEDYVALYETRQRDMGNYTAQMKELQATNKNLMLKLEGQPVASDGTGGHDQESLRKLEEQLNKLKRQQEEYAISLRSQTSELNAMIDKMGQKQTRIFDRDLVTMQDQIGQIKLQLDGIEKQDAIQNGGADHEVDGGVPASATLISRKPPLTKVDSRKNRHVTEMDMHLDQVGKYSGFINMTGLPQGRGILRVDNGDVYEGEWRNGKRHGQGVYTWFDGDLYTGPWVEGKRHGHGVFVFSDGRLYDGEYVEGRREGKGIFSWPYGAKYEGDYADDKRNGHGEYLYADGRKYVGEYLDDRPHGYGIETDKDGIILYDGNWSYGEFIGDGGSIAGSILSSSHRL